MSRQRAMGLTLVALAAVLYSTAGLFARALTIDTWTILAWRALFGTLFMLVWMGVERRGAFLSAFKLDARDLALTAFTTFGSIFYVFALKLTTVANVMVIYATLPFVTMAVMWIWTRERPDRRMIIAGGMALVGVAVMVAGGSGGSTRIAGMGL